MAKTVEGVLEPDGSIRLLEPLTVTKPTRALVTIVPEQFRIPPEVVDTPIIVTTEELERASQETGGRPWPDIRKGLSGE